MPSTVTRAPSRSRDFWIDHVERWKRTTLSKADYCKEHALSVGNFYNWSSPKRCGNVPAGRNENKAAEIKPKAEKSLTFMPVKIDPTADTDTALVRIHRAATDIELPVNMSDEQIKQWLTAIHQLHV